MPCHYLHRRARSRHQLLQLLRDARDGRGEGGEHADLLLLLLPTPITRVTRKPEGVLHHGLVRLQHRHAAAAASLEVCLDPFDGNPECRAGLLFGDVVRFYGRNSAHESASNPKLSNLTLVS